jgi:hypothetical protein
VEDDVESASTYFGDAANTIESLHAQALPAELSVIATARCKALIRDVATLQEPVDRESVQDPRDRALVTLLTLFPGMSTLEDVVESKGASGLSAPGSLEIPSTSTTTNTALWIHYDQRRFWAVYNFATEHVEAKHDRSIEAFCMLERARSRSFLKDVLSRDFASRCPNISGVEFGQGGLTFNGTLRWLASHGDTCTLSFFVGQDESFAWLCLPGEPPSIKMFRMPGVNRTTLDVLLQSTWSASIGASARGDAEGTAALQGSFESLLGTLYQICFAGPQFEGVSLMQTLTAASVQRLVIIPHGQLHFLPLHAARDGDGVYLMDRFEICYAPSASIMNRNLELDRNWGEQVVVVSNPDGTLQAARQELDAIVSHFATPTVVGAGEASVRKVVGMLAESNVMHFGCHGRVGQGIDSSGLMLSSGEFLSVRTLLCDDRPSPQRPYGAKLRLVFLAACETAVERWKVYEEPLSMADAFIAAGAPSVVGTLWKVSDACTAELVHHFYSYTIERGMPVGAALRLAQLEIRKSWPHPWHWAPFVLIGSWR